MLELPELTLFRIHSDAMEISPGQIRRDWMDKTHDRYAYRCTPLNIANSSGWTAHLPFEITVTWDGRIAKNAVAIHCTQNDQDVKRYVTSHFGYGILTFHIGWLLRTTAGWAVWARGAPNQESDGIFPLDGLVETEWLDFPFTMNWKFTRPGSITFPAGHPICFFNLFPSSIIDGITPVARDISSDTSLTDRFIDWRDSRNKFNSDLQDKNSPAARQGWQRKYFIGERAKELGCFHIHKRSLNKPNKL